MCVQFRNLFFNFSLLIPLHKSKQVAGKISLTCDAWQASNTDGYFAATGHWIEERSPGKWTLDHALLGFARMNTAHNGKRLGQALFKICNRLGIVHKVCEFLAHTLFLVSYCSADRTYYLRQRIEQ